MRRLPEGFDGMQCQECFTWSDEVPNKTWAMGSGCSPYYNTHKSSISNTRMVRYFDEDRFEVREIERVFFFLTKTVNGRRGERTPSS